jgi:Carbohydrate binding module (family 35)/Subtilase family
LPRRTAVSLVAVTVLGLLGIGGVAMAAQTPSTARTGASPSHPTKHVCGDMPTRPDRYACLALMQTDTVQAQLAPQATPRGLGPADLQNAYKLPSASAGSGATVAIVDAFDDPKAESDLATYRSQFGLPPCTTANGCFRKVNQNGAASPLPKSDAGWAGEISLDVDMVSAVCPLCKILLVEANTPSNDLFTAIDTAAKMGAKFISNSWGGNESPGQDGFDQQHLNKPGVAITASSGDDGFGVIHPASSRFVTAVGGTSLRRATNSRGWTETAWSGAGSGCSAQSPKPPWQHDTGCPRKTVADVSAVADPATGVAVFLTFGGNGWAVFGGTSASAPIIASVYALAGTPAGGTIPASYPYAHTGNLFDVTSGSNGSCSPSYLCHAGTGFDGPTGLGTPNGTAAFAAGGSPPPPPPAGHFEAENAQLSQATVATNHTGFTGTGFVDYANVAGSFVEWTASRSKAGSARLTIRYANGTTANRPMTISVNGGAPMTVNFPSTGSWNTWGTAMLTVNLPAGTDRIRATATVAAGGPNVDWLEIA